MKKILIFSLAALMSSVVFATPTPYSIPGPVM